MRREKINDGMDTIFGNTVHVLLRRQQRRILLLRIVLSLLLLLLIQKRQKEDLVHHYDHHLHETDLCHFYRLAAVAVAVWKVLVLLAITARTMAIRGVVVAAQIVERIVGEAMRADGATVRDGEVRVAMM